MFWRVVWQNRAKLSPQGTRVFEYPDGNQITSTSHRFINNLAISRTLPPFFPGAENLLLQLNVDNVLRRTPSKIEQAAGHFGFAELIGRSYTFTLQRAFFISRHAQVCRLDSCCSPGGEAKPHASRASQPASTGTAGIFKAAGRTSNPARARKQIGAVPVRYSDETAS